MEMIGGIMKTSRFALAAAAGLLLGAAMTSAPAKAADLGGGCCADLEERVAELEATTARKGNRVVSLQVYGQINKALMIWDNGTDSDVFVVDGEQSGSRFGFVGKAKIKPGWTAGYNMEFDVVDNGSNHVTATNDEGVDGEPGVDGTPTLRQNYFYVESETLGRISVGHQSTAADGATEVVLGNSLAHSGIQGGAKFLGGHVNNLDGGRADVVRYDSPAIYGFILSASWGENDYADVALRFKKEFNSIRLVAGIGYVWAEEADTEEVAGSISVMHVPTGLYVAFAAADADTEGSDLDKSMWYVQAGIEKKLLPYGSTTIYGEYGKYSEIALANVEATKLGFGIVQKIDSAAMDIYAQAQMYDLDNTADDVTTVMIGSRIKF
jgi:predicted porin